MKHRGPDGNGLWMNDNRTVGLAHRRLAIVDLSPQGAQPMLNPEAGTAITFNGEIYNFERLKPSLEARGVQLRSRSDTEVLLAQLTSRGAEGLTDVAGDFAFGFWDPRDQTLLMARDRAGMKPLFYAETESGHFVFASELRALLTSGLVPFEIDEEALYHYLTFLVSPPGRSLVKRVRKLRAGEALRFDLQRGKLEQWFYWEPTPGQSSRDNASLNDEFRELFDASVRDRLMSDVQVGTLFSGGVDSILNTSVFQRETKPKPVQTYTVGMPGQRTDESVWAREIAMRLGTDRHEVMIDEARVEEDLEELCWAQDEPIADPVTIPLYYVTRLARENGTTVLQGGEGADEVLCGYPGYLKHLSVERKYWNHLLGLPKSLLKIGGSLAAWAQPLHPEAGRAADMLHRAGGDEAFYLSKAVAFSDTEKTAALNPVFRKSMDGVRSNDIVAPIYKRLAETAPDATPLQRLTFVELNLRLPELLLMRLDKIAMANSIEVRAPFLDHRLIEFAMRAPDEFKVFGGVLKDPVKRYAAEFVERDAVYRPKKGFGAPIDSWFQGALGAQLREHLAHNPIAEQYFNTNTLARRTGKPMTSRQGFQLWIVLNMLKWHERLSSTLTEHSPATA